jgi:tRNA nucleotidyltransferase (CCA-adding enzyme)
MELMDVASEKPLVDGKELVKKLRVKPGPWMKPALDLCMEWQLRNPGVKDTSPAIEEVRAKQEQLKIPM